MAGKAASASGVVEMLKEDHEKVKGLFEEFESAEGGEQAEIAATPSWNSRSMLNWRRNSFTLP
jgi:hypothetical protein